MLTRAVQTSNSEDGSGTVIGPISSGDTVVSVTAVIVWVPSLFTSISKLEVPF